MAWIRLLLLLSIVLLLGACASVPTEYLRLQAEGQPLPSQALGEKHRVLIVDHVEMPASIDRLYLTRGNSENGMEVSGHVRWISPLGGMTQRVLAEDLRRRLADSTVLLAGSPLPSNAKPLSLQVQVQEFLPSSNSKVIIDADYFLLDADQHLRYAGHFRDTVGAGGSAVRQAQAMSRCIAALARHITQHLPAEYRPEAR